MAEKGVWADVPNGIGARGGPSVHFDSKGIIWIVGGSYGEGAFLNAGWNYNLDSDQYRWVAGQAQSTSRYQNLGTKGIAGPDVFPGYLGDASTSVIDSKDQIWIYAENSLFRWNTTNGYFTFLGGDPSSVLAPSVPGTPGEPSPDVWPGGIDSACMVLDSHDNFWLIGGMVSSNGKNFVSNTVWHYNTTSGYWTFVYGNTTGSVDNNFAEIFLAAELNSRAKLTKVIEFGFLADLSSTILDIFMLWEICGHLILQLGLGLQLCQKT